MGFDFVVKVNDMKRVHELALVFVDPLDLNIEDRIEIGLNSRQLCYVIRERLFIALLDFSPFFLELSIRRQRFKLFHFIKVCSPAIANFAGDQFRQTWIALQEPSTLGNAVRFVVESFRHHLEKILE